MIRHISGHSNALLTDQAAPDQMTIPLNELPWLLLHFEKWGQKSNFSPYFHPLDNCTTWGVRERILQNLKVFTIEHNSLLGLTGGQSPYK